MNKAVPKKSFARLDESLLSHVPAFSRLDRLQIREILDQASARRYESGQPIFHEGEQADRFFMLLDGYVRVMRIGANGEKVIGLHIPPGQLFGIAKALSRTTYPATAITAVESLGISWPSTVWDRFSADYDGFSTETYKTVGDRLGEMNSRMMEMATLQVEQRIANVLLRMINQTGRKVENGILIDFPITRQDLSDMAGTTLHTVSRLLSAWEKQGLVKSERKQITVCQPHQLVELGQAKPEN